MSLKSLKNKVNLMEVIVSALEETAGIMEVDVAVHLESLETKVDHLNAEVSKVRAASG